MGRRTALLAGILYGLYPFTSFRERLGLTPSGAGGHELYFLVGMACLTAAARGQRPTLALLAAGAAGIASFYTHPVAFAALHAYLIYYPVAVVAYGGDRPWRKLLHGVALMAVGALTLTLALGMVNRNLGGPFWFYLTSIRYGADLVSVANPWYEPHMNWLRAPWLYAHVFAVGVCLTALFARLARPARGCPGRPACNWRWR